MAIEEGTGGAARFLPPEDAALVGSPATGSGGGGGSGSGGGGGGEDDPAGGTDYSGPGKDYNDGDDAARFLGLGGHPEVWKDTTTGQFYLMYPAAGGEPPVPLLYEVYGGMDTLKGYFGDGVDVVFDREMDTATMNTTGAVKFGSSNNLVASEGDPWMGFKDRMERYAEVSPFANDPEILGLMGGAYLEGRKLETWELETTDWWQDHNERERDWLQTSMSDPASAAQRMEDDRIKIASMFDSIGADGTDPALINWLAGRHTSGVWSQSMLSEQIEAVTSGWSTVDSDLQAWLDGSGVEIESTKTQHEKVRSMFNEWLGPAFEPTEGQVAEWATKLRNSADGQEELVSMLRGQRLAQYPEYEDPNLTYQNIAGAWRNLGESMWGERMDETSPMFQEILHANDYGTATQLLRTEGLAQDNEKVWKDNTKQFHADQSTNVRRAI